MGPGQKILVLVWKISPKNPKIFNFLPFGSKKHHLVGQKVPWSKPGHPLIY